MITNNKSQRGFVMAILLSIMVVTTILILTITSRTIANYQSATYQNSRTNAQFAADSGLDVGISELNADSDYTGTGGEVELLNNSDLRTTYEIVVDNGATSDKKIITSTGKAYVPSSSTTPRATRTFQLEADAVTSGNGPSSVVTGVGGLILNNNSKISGGDVVVNGSVTVSNNASIGLSTNPVNVRVAHQSCPNPVDSTYPKVCTSGQPITANGKIYGNVQAQNQTNGTNMSKPGLTSSTFAPVSIPGYNRPAQKAAVTTTLPSTDNSIKCSNNATKNWPANLKITGNVSISNNCTVNLAGNVWITGNLSMGNNARIVVPNSLGATRPVMMVDGSTGITFGNNAVVTPNSSNTGVEFISTWWNTNTATNGGFTCGGIADPLDCTNVTGLALSTSQTTTTLDFSNNSTASYSVLRTLWSRVNIANNGAIGAVQGQTIQLGNNAIINFTASIPGSDNLVTTWVKRGYIRVFQ